LDNTPDLVAALAAAGRLNRVQTDLLERRRRETGVTAHRALVELGLMSEADAYQALAELLQLDFIEPAQLRPDPQAVERVPLRLIFNYRMLPVAEADDGLTLAFAEPPSATELGKLRLLLGTRIRVALTTPAALAGVLKQHFGLGAETLQNLNADAGGGELPGESVFDVSAGEDGSAMDATISRLVDQVLAEAVRLRATDIHIEPYAASIRLRYRIDGLMQSVPIPAALRDVHAALVSRLKIMAGLNIAEHRLPQDGRISMKSGGHDFDLRVSVIPTKHGEAVCLRLLGRQRLFGDLASLGMEPEQEALFGELVRLPQGFILITGPTGSGKTTTLYAALACANDEGRKIITIEDPIEYLLEGVTQIQTRDDIGLTFASGLRSVLRHDPDVVLIGEIRDRETAETAVRAAQTGHLVFSTLHTNDSISAPTRLLEMGIDPFLLSSSLVCSIAQRLARRICPHCRQPDPDLAPGLREEMASALAIQPEAAAAWRGAGCEQCNGQGTLGRVALYEFFVLHEDIADAIRPDTRTSGLRQMARQYGWRSLRENGWSKVQAGLITPAELERLTSSLGPQSRGRPVATEPA